jgi:membrane protease YdiL (CAAX protease family)
VLEGLKMDMAASTNNKGFAKHLWLFLVVVFLWSWTIWMVSGVLPRAGTGGYDFRWLVAQIGAFGPSLAALAVSATVRRELRQNSLRILPVLVLALVGPGVFIAESSPSSVAEFGILPSVVTVIVGAVMILSFSPVNRRLRSPGTGHVQEKPEGRWVLLSVVLFPALFLISWLLVNFRSGGWEISAFRNGALGFVWLVLVSFSHNALLGGPLGEEIGWRGFLLPALLTRNGPLTASLLLAVVWGLWHLPIDLYAGFLVKGPGAVVARIVWTFPMTILFTWIFLRTKCNMLVAIFLHASIGMLSDFGFSNYSASLVVFFILMTIGALVVSISSRVFRARPRTDIHRVSAGEL